MKALRIGIFIPVFNAASTLPRVLDRIPEEIREEVAEIFVIDNDSPDNSYLIAVGYREWKSDHKLSVFRNVRNLGYGGSQKVAYQYAIEQGYDVIVMLHGDAQYAPEYLVHLLRPFRERDDVDLVFGSRMRGDPRAGGMPLIRFLGNRFLTWIENRVLGTALSEFHSGYRVFSCAALRQIPFTSCSNDYHFDSEIIVQLIAAKKRILEVPIPTRYAGERSHVNVWSYGLNVLKVMALYELHRRGWRYSAVYDVSKPPELESYRDLTMRI